MSAEVHPAQLPSRPEGARARRTYETLLAAMERLLAEGGYPAATTTAVAEEAGVSVGTVYRYAADRDELLAALFADRLDGVLDAVDGALDLEVLLDDGLHTLLARVIDTVVHAYARHAATVRAALVQLPGQARIRAVYWDRHDRGRRLLTAFLRRAQTAGQVTAADPAVLADTVLVLVQGLNHPVLLADPDTDHARAVAARITEALTAVLRPV